MTASSREFNQVFAQLKDDGLLLLSDSELPSVSTLVAGETVRGSWWSHKRAQIIFNVSEMLEDHKDVLIMKLISGKVTFVYRDLWNWIYSIGVAREDWQLRKLTPRAQRMLKMLDIAGRIEMTELGQDFGPKPGEVAREMESRLLVYSAQIHTKSGKHSKVLETWDAWAKRAGFRPRTGDPLAARRSLEQRLRDLNTKHNGHGLLPWPSTLKNRD